MFFHNSPIYWFLATCSAVSLSSGLILLERIRKQVYERLPADLKSFYSPSWRSIMKRSVRLPGFRGYSRVLLEQHRQHYPSSSLRKSFGITLWTAVISAVGLFVVSE